jgi:hypothetical protein
MNSRAFVIKYPMPLVALICSLTTSTSQATPSA